jgi:hypothetical protein
MNKIPYINNITFNQPGLKTLNKRMVSGINYQI